MEAETPKVVLTVPTDHSGDVKLEVEMSEQDQKLLSVGKLSVLALFNIRTAMLKMREDVSVFLDAPYAVRYKSKTIARATWSASGACTR